MKRIKTIDDQNDEIRAQVECEYPYPKGGFENANQLDEWKDKTEKRFMELVRNYQPL